jgi:hypothetical protein
MMNLALLSLQKKAQFMNRFEHMKTLVIIYLSLVILAFAGCQKSNQDATVPTVTTDCLNNPNLCNSGAYQQSPGFTSYNYGYGYGYNNSIYGSGYNPYAYGTGSLCNCPIGTVPTYNNYSGLGCVRSSLIYGFAYVTIGYSSNNNQWTNMPQISNTVGYGGVQGSRCYQGVVQSCLVGDSSSCSTGYTCRATGASSHLGICGAVYN